MSKKILTVLVPVAALVAFMAVPTMAQAKTQLQAPAGTALKVGAAFQGQGTLVTTSASGKLECKESVFHGLVTANAGLAGGDSAASITSSQFDAAPPGCPTSTAGVTVDVTTNAGAGAAAWTVQVQQPAAGAGGAVLAHILPGTSGVIQLTWQYQAGATDIGTCHYKATSVQLNGTTGNHVFTIAADTQFEVEGQTESVCGPNGTKITLSGSMQLESGANKLVVSQI